LVVETEDLKHAKSQFWLHSSEGETIVRIFLGDNMSEFDFNIDTDPASK
jgi:hypothetical protein